MSQRGAVAEQEIAVATITTPPGPVATIDTSRGSVAAVMPGQAVAAVARQQSPVATVGGGQGPAGRPGRDAAAPVAYSISAAASFTANHGLPFAPETWLTTPAGELVEADVFHTSGATTVAFAQPFTGTLLLR